jgi:hypothetical protein
MRMRLVMIMSIAALAATSACGSSSHDHASGAGRTDGAPRAAAASPSTAKADIPDFSGPVEASSGNVTHLYGRCLHSWYAKAGSGLAVHVEYPGPATVSVDLTITDQSEPPPEAHQQFTLAQGKKAKDLRFPAVPHAGFPQVTVTTGQTSKTCEAPAH